MSKLTTEQFIVKAKQIHGDKYDYSLVEYVSTKTKVKIICPVHGIFEQTPDRHLQKRGCFRCYSSIDTFIKKAAKIHSDRYDYSLVTYINSQTKIKIVCHIHGVFEQEPNSHLCKRGCPKCKISLGENKVKQHLENKEITFIEQKRFDECKNKRPLPFDFYLPDYNMCIEFDGEQHFKPERRSKDEQKNISKFESVKFRDTIKTQFCIDKNIKLIRIPYWDIKNIEIILDNIFT